MKLKVRDFDIEISFKDREGWELGDMIGDALQCINNTAGLTPNDIILIETRGT
jgi:hypothetical protein